MKWPLVVVQGLALAILALATLSHVMDVRVTLPLDISTPAPAPGTMAAYALPALIAPFVPTAMGRPITLLGHGFTADDAPVHCPSAAMDAISDVGPCYVYNATLLVQTDVIARLSRVGAVVTIAMPARASLLVLGLAAYLALAAFFWRRLATTRAAHGVAAGLVIAVLGGGVLASAAVGAIKGDRAAEVGAEGRNGPITLSYAGFVEHSKRRSGEDDLAYAVRLTSAISAAVSDIAPASARFEVSFAAHWPLRVLADLDPAFLDYIYWDPYRIVHWGRGQCGHVSSAFVGIARQNGLDARMVTLLGHVVATVEVRPGEWHLFDADFGVHIPHDLKTVEARPELLRAAYETLPFWAGLNPAFAAMTLKAFATAEDNLVDPAGRLSYHSNFQFAGLTQPDLEPLLDRLRFLAPAALLALGLLIAGVSHALRRRPTGDRPAAPAQIA